MGKQERPTPLVWAYYDPAREARWEAEKRRCLLRTMARDPDWGRALLDAWRGAHGPRSAERLRREANAMWLAMREAGEL